MECFSLLALMLACIGLATVLLLKRRVAELQRHMLSLERQLETLSEVAPPPARTKPERVPTPEPEPVPLRPRDRAPELSPEPPPEPLRYPSPPQAAPTASHRPTQRASNQLESKIGARWLVLAGAGTLFLGFAFLLKYSFDQGWLGPTARVVGGAVLGCVLFLRGLLWQQRYPSLASGFCGAGAALLYAVVWAAHWLFHLIPHPLALGVMVAITAATWLAAFRLRALAIGILALVGGFATPLLLPGEAQTPHALFAYAALLSAAAIALRWLRSWPQLAGVAVLGVTALFLAWCETHRDLASQAWALSVWATLFALLFVIGLPFLATVRRRSQHPADLATVGIAAVLCLLVNLLVFDQDSQTTKAAMTLVESALYAAAAFLHRRRVFADPRGAEGLWLPAAALLVAAAPVAFGHGVLTVTLAILGLLLLHAAGPLEARAVAFVGAVSLAWSVVRVLEQRWLVAMPLAMFGRVEHDGDLPFVSPTCLAELVVITALGFLGWRGKVAAEHRRVCACGAVLMLVAYAAGETMAVLVRSGWPHASPGFDRAVAWAWPLVLAGCGSGLVAARVAAKGRPTSGFSFLLLLTALLCSLFAAAHGTELPRDVRWLAQAATALGPILLVALATRWPVRPAWLPKTRVDVTAAIACVAMLLAVAGEVGRVLGAQVAPGLHPYGPTAIALVVSGLVVLRELLTRGIPTRERLVRATVLLAGLPLLLALAELAARTAGWPHEPVRACAARGLPFVALALGLSAARRGPAANFVGELAAGFAVALPLAWIDRLQAERATPILNLPFLILAAPALALLTANARRLRLGNAAASLAHACLFVLVVLLSAESYGFGRHLETGSDSLRSAHAALSICWTVCASALLALGIALPARVPRLAGLVLFALTLGKLVVIDLAELPLPYRIVSFMGCGLALMGGGWLYNRFAVRISAPRADA